MLNTQKGRKFSFFLFMAIASIYCYGDNALAVTGTELINPVKTFLTENLIKNTSVIGVLVASIVGLVAALGQQIGKFVLNNLAYVGYAAFGATVSLGALTAAGITI